MLCSITEAAHHLGYRSRAQLYRMKQDGWLDDNIQMIDGKTYLRMDARRGKPTLARHIMGIIDRGITDRGHAEHIKDIKETLNAL